MQSREEKRESGQIAKKDNKDLMGFAQKNARKFGLDSSAILAEMKSGDYENLVQVFDKYFGEYVILET